MKAIGENNVLSLWNESGSTGEEVMLTKSADITDTDPLLPHVLTEEQSREMKENLAREYFDMSLDEFTKAWKAGKFDNDKKRHGDVMFLVAMLPEAWVK